MSRLPKSVSPVPIRTADASTTTESSVSAEGSSVTAMVSTLPARTATSFTTTGR